MRFEHEGMSLWYDSAPGDVVPPESNVSLTIAVQPADASNRVEVTYRVNQGTPQKVSANPVRHAGKTQYFRAAIPASAFGAGDTVQYVAICRRAGRQVPSPAEVEVAASFRVVDGSTPSKATAVATPTGSSGGSVSATRRVMTPAPSTAAPPNLGTAISASAVTPVSRPNAGKRSVSGASRTLSPTTAPRGDNGSPAGSGPAQRIVSQAPPKTAISAMPSAALPVPPATAPAGPSLADLATVVGLPANSTFLSRLAKQGIVTLADARRAGGVSKLASPGDAATARLIDYHADLSRVSSNLAANNALIAAGYSSTQKIAAASRTSFLAVAAPVLGVTGAARVQVVATSMYRALDQVLVAAHVDSANGRASGLPSNLDQIINPSDQDVCYCCDCQAAQSPAAYLADLLSYVVTNVQNQGLPIDLQFLVDTFHQPFGDLPTDCEAVDQQVRQVRICVEVLRSYVGLNAFPALSSAQAVHNPTASQLAALATAQAAYLIAAYSALLLGIGTTYQELGLARNADTAARIALAERLGLTIDPYGSSRPDQLDKLLLDSTISPPAPQALGEATLECTFGLADSTRNPLSDGPTLNDPTQQIMRWNLTGISWGENTDQDGKIYVALTNAGSTQQVALYKNSSLNAGELVAAGNQWIVAGVIDGSIPVYEENESGLSGTLWIASPITTTAIALGAVPLLTSWQLQTLRNDWLAEDHPPDTYIAGVTAAGLAKLPGPITWPTGYNYDPAAQVLILDHVMTLAELALLLGVIPTSSAFTTAVKTLYVNSQRLPVIDPDVIGPDDFRIPVPNAQSNPQPYDLWQNRRSWVDSLLNELKPLTITGMFALLGSNVKYTPVIASAVPTTTIPWSSATPYSSFESLWENLAEGVDVAAITLQIAADLGLTIDAFNRMMDIWHVDAAAAADPRNPAVSDDAWRELYSILAQAVKTRFFEVWRSEEAALALLMAPSVTLGSPALLTPPPVLFGSPAFVVSITEPAVGDWPPVVPPGQPLIDPALVALTGLPDPTVGATAINFWNQRSEQVAQLKATLRQARETISLEAALEAALGSPLPVDLDTLAQQLLDADPTVGAAATATIESTLFMSVDDFNTLMTIRAMAADPSPLGQPTAAQWSELYDILTVSATKRTLYPTPPGSQPPPNWLSEEADPTTGVVYWTARKAALPLWRASVDTRAQWHAALAFRTGAPIIDPDVIGPSDLTYPVPGDSAFDLWTARTTEVQSWLQALPVFQPPTKTVDLADVDNALMSVGIKGPELDELSSQSGQGTDITPRLAQLGLTTDAFTAVAGLRALLEAGVPILSAEWDSFCSIVVQVAKQLQFAAWRQDEADKNIILGPDLFQLAASTSGATCGASVGPSCASAASTQTPALPAWRATAEGRQAWEDTLNTRVEQQNTVISAVENVADSAEGATLTQLRDALIWATDAPGADLCTKADWLTTKLMIDAETGGCQKITRIEQALETLQSVMNGLRDGLIGSIDITFIAPPACISSVGPGVNNVFVCGSDNALWHRQWTTSGGWSDWESLGGFWTSAPAVTSQMYNNIDVFARGADNALWHLAFDGAQWSQWESLGGFLYSAPSACSQEQGSYDVFVLGNDWGLWQLSGGMGAWGPFQPVARTAPLPTGGINSAPAVVASGTGVYDVFVKGGDNALWHAQYDGSAWTGWESLGGILNVNTGPAVTSATPGVTMDVFVQGTDSAVWRLSWQQGSGWGAWTSLGGSATQGPGASSWGGGRLDVFIAGPDQTLMQNWWDGSSWNGWQGTGGLTINDPNFDEEWTWMGAYSTWRAAILVFMYPENILDPTLRKWQTPAFQTLVQTIRSAPAVTPDVASSAVRTYVNYYVDICNLIQEGTANVYSAVYDTGGPGTNDPSYSEFFTHIYGRGGKTNTVYWSYYRASQASTGYAQSFWDAVPGVGNNVAQIIGGETYWVPAGKRFLFLFLRTYDADSDQLCFTRYDPDAQLWDGTTYPLALNAGWNNFVGILGGQANEGDPPRIAVQLLNGTVFERQLNYDGTNWDTPDWVQVGIWGSWSNLTTNQMTALSAPVAVAQNPNHMDAFFASYTTPPTVGIYSAWWDAYQNGGQWSAAFQIDSNFQVLDASLCAVSRQSGRIDIFVAGDTPSDPGGVWWNYWDSSLNNAQWQTFNQIMPDNTVNSSYTLSAAWRTSSHLDVFAVGVDSKIYWVWWDTNTWSPLSAIGGPSDLTQSGQIGVGVRQGGDRLDIFMVSNDGQVWQNWSLGATPTQWQSTWQAIPGLPQAASDMIAVVARSATRLDIFAKVLLSNGQVELWWNASDLNVGSGDWTGWQPVESTAEWIGTGLSAIAQAANQVDVFGVASTTTYPNGPINLLVWQDTNDSGNWQLTNLGPALGDISFDTPVAIVSRFPGRVDVFAWGSTTQTNPTTGQIIATYYQTPSVGTSPPLPGVPIIPAVTAPLDIPSSMSSADLQTRRGLIMAAFEANLSGPASNLEYLKEAYYFIPMYVAEQLQGNGQYTQALDWFRTIYDYTAPVALRNIYYGFELEKSLPGIGALHTDWLHDPLNPHVIAVTRKSAYLRYTVLTIVQCLLDYADARFTYDTSESDVQARALYMTALTLLGLAIFEETADSCEDLTIVVQGQPNDDQRWSGVLASLQRDLATVNSVSVLSTLAPKIQQTLAGDAPIASRFAAARALVSQAKRQMAPAPAIGKVVAEREASLSSAYQALLSSPIFDPIVTAVTEAAGSRFDSAMVSVPAPEKDLAASRAVLGRSFSGRNGTSPADGPMTSSGLGVPVSQAPVAVLSSTFPALDQSPNGTVPPVKSGLASARVPMTLPEISFSFCIPTNPLIDTLRQHAELNLYKLRNCMNIAGISRQVDPYSAPTDVLSGLPSIGSGGQLVIPGAVVIQPMPYSYSVLIARAQQLVQTAAQMEAAMLAALQQQDQATYDELQARQNLAVATATVQLQSLTVTQATDGVALAQLQQQQAQITTDHWQQMLGSDVASLEQNAIGAQYIAVGLQAASAVASFAAAGAGAVSPGDIVSFGASSLSSTASGFSALAGAANSTASALQSQASLEVQQDDWQYQYALGLQGNAIANQQVTNAQQQVRIAGQQLNIATLQAANSQAVLDFLSNKFTNAALYQWMSGVLQGVYSYFLRQATAVAKLAENQMAFERQQVPPSFIQADYWQPPSAATLNSSPGTNNTQGLTGSARLTQDIAELDDYYFETDQRKLQLSKTISLAQLYPVELQRLRDTGVMNFTTPMALFDQDFPGHYLRLIQSVSTSVIALIPPSLGIRATLSTTGTTYTVTGPQVFQKVVVSRTPQSISITSPINATGVFAVDPQANLLLPFQGLGVEAQWQFSMPQAANPFDYTTLADVQITINYTALDSPDYRVQVLRALSNQYGADQAYSFRNDLADQWYDLHNPNQTATPMSVQFNTVQTDFPPNLNDLRIQQVVLYFSRSDGASFEVSVSALRFAEGSSTSTVGGAATTINGVISTRSGNAASWIPMIGKSPFGTWQLTLPNTDVVKAWFAQDIIDDILFVITYSAQTPPYPSS